MGIAKYGLARNYLYDHFNFIPIYGLIIAFKRYTVIDTLETAPWVGFENFQIILNDKFFGDQL